MNIYQMYYKNDKQLGFYVIRNTWGNTIARIVGIEGIKENGSISGRYPYFSNKKVEAEFYDFKGVDRKGLTVQQLCTEDYLVSRGELSCPGNYSYTMLPNDLKYV